MGAAEKLPAEELALSAGECAELWGMGKDWWLRTVACRPGFPLPVSRKPYAWIAGEVLDYRRNNRA